MKTVGFAKFGTKMYFDKDKWKHTGGFSEAINLIKILAKEFKVNIISNNDLDKFNTLPTEKKLINIESTHKKKKQEIDYLVVLNGLVGAYNNINLDTGKPCLNMFRNGTWPIIDYINKSKIPWIYLLTDSRYKWQDIKDLDHPPLITISQYDDLLDDIIYGYLEEAWLYGKKPKEVSHKHFLNTHNIDFYFNAKGKRTSKIKKFINGSRYKINVYGDMGETIKEKQLPIFYDATKYTLNIGMDSRWITQKWNEFAHHNVIQFAYEYDDQCRKYPKNSWLRVKDVDEFDGKIQILESNPEFYEELINISNEISPKAYTGENILNTIKHFLR